MVPVIGAILIAVGATWAILTCVAFLISLVPTLISITIFIMIFCVAWLLLLIMRVNEEPEEKSPPN